MRTSIYIFVLASSLVPLDHINAKMGDSPVASPEERSGEELYQAGILLANQSTRQEDDAKAVRLLRRAAAKGFPPALFAMGFMSEQGRGVPKSSSNAVQWYARAADKGNIRAQVQLGLAYTRGKIVSQDLASALKWFQMAAEQGHVLSQGYVGSMYDLGQGTPENNAEAAKWFMKAAEGGLAPAQARLGIMLRDGEGVAVDKKLSVLWLERSAAQNYALAKHQLGIHFSDNGDFANASEWFKAAAKQGYADAQYELACMYLNGNGVPQSNVKAYAWLSLAGSHGNEDAIGLEKKLLPHLDTEQINQAKALAAKCKAANYAHCD